MTIAIIGYGTQGKKRSQILKNKKVSHFIVDPYYPKADSKFIEKLNYNYDHAFICTPDNLKLKIIMYLLKKNIKVLVEKPLYFDSLGPYTKISNLLKKFKQSLLYVAYNHRFEPNIIKLKKYLDKKTIGKIYSVDMYYGNGTAKLWKNSLWRQKDRKGVVIDLAPHLLDIYLYLFDELPKKGKLFTNLKCENINFDFAKFGCKNKNISITFTTSLIDWKNKFEINIIGSKGSLHVNNLCKWDDSYFIYRKRILPSGIPKELVIKCNKGDPTWDLEHDYFLKTNKRKQINYKNDKKINKFINSLYNA